MTTKSTNDTNFDVHSFIGVGWL